MSGVSLDLTGGSDLGRMLELKALLTDPQFGERMQQLADKEAEIDRKLALAGPADAILQLRDQAEQNLISSKQVLVDAQAEADETTKAADALHNKAWGKARSIRSTARVEAERRVAEAQELERRAVELNAELAIAISDAKAREEAADRRELAASKAEDDANIARELHESKLARILAAAA